MVSKVWNFIRQKCNSDGRTNEGIVGILFLWGVILGFEKGVLPTRWTTRRAVQADPETKEYLALPVINDSANNLPYPLCIKYLTDANLTQETRTPYHNSSDMRNLDEVLAGRSIAMIGDSRMRDMFVYIRRRLQNKTFTPWAFSEDQSFFDHRHRIRLDFFWCRYPDGRLKRLLRRWKRTEAVVPQYILIQIGVWSVYHDGEKGAARFNGSMDQVAEGFVSIQNKSDVIWLRTLPGHPKSANRTFAFTTTESTRLTVERFGDIAMDVAVKHHLPVWTSAHDAALANPQWYRDEVHPGPQLLNIFLQQLLSALKNNPCQKKEEINQTHKYRKAAQI